MLRRMEVEERVEEDGLCYPRPNLWTYRRLAKIASEMKRPTWSVRRLRNRFQKIVEEADNTEGDQQQRLQARERERERGGSEQIGESGETDQEAVARLVGGGKMADQRRDPMNERRGIGEG